MTRVLVTGASGFVGSQLCEALCRQGYIVRGALRADQPLFDKTAEKAVVGEIGAHTSWARALDGVDCVVHCAARAHHIGDQRSQQHLYMEANAMGTERLAQACLAARVRRFVYLSSVKVNGEGTRDRPFSRLDRPTPADPYALSKWEGETRLQAIAASSPMETAIVRSPLVYGPRVRANFLRLLRWVDGRLPLPFGAVKNSRSLVSVWNLCSLIERLLRDAIPKNGVFMVSDGADLSTPELIRKVGVALGRPARLLPVPVTVLRALGALSGRRAEVERLCGSLIVDISSTCSDLGWRPPVSVDDGLARTAAWYLSRGNEP
jgi:nucleoside-diphosphate-sugar epimerase